MQVRTPAKLLRLVWPLPRSLATTNGISVDVFSSPYLDVSVQAVPLVQLCIHCTIPLAWWVAPFRNLRIKAYLQLPEAYRSLSRLSSAPDAKAFPLYSLKLDLRRCGLRILRVRLKPNAHSLRRTSSQRQTRFAGLCRCWRIGNVGYSFPTLKGSFCLVTYFGSQIKVRIMQASFAV